MNQKVTFYVDGFNFYYGLKRAMKSNPSWTNYYWIDIVKLFSKFLSPNQVLDKVIYFTSSPQNPAQNKRQGAFLNANKHLNPNKFEVVRGRYLNKPIKCALCKKTFTRPEEKKTDVNISVRMLTDCITNKTDSIVLVSADTDLIPPLDAIKKIYPSINLKVYFPPNNSSNEISSWTRKNKLTLNYLEHNERRFKESIMPDTVGKYHIPPEWKAKQHP